MSSRVFSIFFFTILIGIFWLARAQHSRSNLEKQRKKNLEEIKATQASLQSISHKKKTSLGELSLIKQQISVQRQLIATLQKEIKQLDQDIEKTDEVIVSLEEDLKKIREEYSEMIYVASKSTTSINRLTFIFASASINQLYLRLRYVQQYAKARKSQVDQILSLSQSIQDQRDKSKEIKKEKETLLQEKLQESKRLNTLQANKDRLFKRLAQQEKQLRKDLQTRQQNIAKLEKLIDDLLTGTPQTRKRPKKKKAPPPVNLKVLNKQFASSKGKMPWPVNKGFIAVPFGTQPHPVLKGVKVDNAGIDIQASKGQGIKSVFKGEVTTIATIPGLGGKVIMIQHGEYFSVYARVKNIQVSVGEWVNTNQNLATIFTDDKGISQLQFQIWKKNTKLNPATWLRKK